MCCQHLPDMFALGLLHTYQANPSCPYYIYNMYNAITTYVTGFVKIDPNHTGSEIHFIAEH